MNVQQQLGDWFYLFPNGTCRVKVLSNIGRIHSDPLGWWIVIVNNITPLGF